MSTTFQTSWVHFHNKLSSLLWPCESVSCNTVSIHTSSPHTQMTGNSHPRAAAHQSNFQFKIQLLICSWYCIHHVAQTQWLLLTCILMKHCFNVDRKPQNFIKLAWFTKVDSTCSLFAGQRDLHQYSHISNPQNKSEIKTNHKSSVVNIITRCLVLHIVLICFVHLRCKIWKPFGDFYDCS